MQRLVHTVILLLGLAQAQAQEVGDDLSVLAEARTHAIMRHALAPGTSDPDGFRVEDCATQRNLNDAGRAQARDTGAVFAERGAEFDAVWTSQWCRCRDTAGLLGLGAPVEVPALNSFFENRSDSRPQTDALRAQLLALDPGETVMMVTHQVNISALLGRSTRSGEVVLFTIAGDGSTEERGSFVVPVR